MIALKLRYIFHHQDRSIINKVSSGWPIPFSILTKRSLKFLLGRTADEEDNKQGLQFVLHNFLDENVLNKKMFVQFLACTPAHVPTDL